MSDLLVFDVLTDPGARTADGIGVELQLIASTTNEGAPGYVGHDHRTILGKWATSTNSGAGLWKRKLRATPPIAPSGAYYRAQPSPRLAAAQPQSFRVPCPVTSLSGTGAISLSAATISVVSTAASGGNPGFSGSGQVVIAGQTITYTGITATSFTGCSGGTGTAPAGTSVYQPTGPSSALTSSVTVVAAPTTFSVPADTTGMLDEGHAELDGERVIRYSAKTGLSLTGCTLVSGSTGTVDAGTTVRQAWWVGDVLTDPPANLPDPHTLTTDEAHAASAISTSPIVGVAGDDVQEVLTSLHNLKIDKATLDAQSVLAAVTDDTPVALPVPPSTVVGRKATGDVTTLLGGDIASLIGAGTVSDADAKAVREKIVAARITAKNVRDYGALGDGLNDDSIAIRAARDAAGIGGSVYIPSGSYRLYEYSIQPLDEQTWILEQGAVLTADPYVTTGNTGIRQSYNRGHIEIIHKRDVVVVGGEIDGNRDLNNGGRLFGVLVIGNCSRIRVQGMYIHHCPSEGGAVSYGDGVYIGQGEGAYLGLPDDVIIREVVVEACGRQNMTVVHGHNIRFLGCTSRNAAASGIDIEPNTGSSCERITISACAFIDNGVININLSSHSGPHIVVTNNLLRMSNPVRNNIHCFAPRAVISGNAVIGGRNGIELLGRSVVGEEHWGRHVVVSSNVVEGCTHGIRFSGNFTLVANNTIKDCTSGGIIVDGAVADCVDSIVIGNLLVNGVDPATAQPDYLANIEMRISPTRITVVGNSITDTRSGTARAQYGIRVTSSSNNEHLTHVVFANNINNMAILDVSGLSNTSRNQLQGVTSFSGGQLFVGAGLRVTHPAIRALQLWTGDAAQRTSMSIGRTTDEHEFGICGASGQFIAGTAAGDAVLHSIGSATRLFIGVAGTSSMRIGKDAIGFYNTSPVAKPTALTAPDSATVDATYGAEESGVINNLRTRVNELESKLRSLGLLT